MAKITPGFLSDEQKVDHFKGIAGLSKDQYNYVSTLKIYEGAEILLYHYNKNGLLCFDTVLCCAGFVANEKGMKVTLINRKDFKITTIGDIPNPIANLDILTSVPVRCVMERTVKVTQGGHRILGMATAVLFRGKSNPIHRLPGHVHAIPLTKARKYFQVDEYAAAENRAALEV